MQNYLVIWPDGTARLMTHDQIKYPAKECEGNIAIIQFKVSEFDDKPVVTLETYYRAGYVDLV